MEDAEDEVDVVAAASVIVASSQRGSTDFGCTTSDYRKCMGIVCI